MEIEFDKDGTTWNEEMTPKQIFEREFNIGHFLLNNKHPLIEKLIPILFCQYKCVFKFIDKGYNNERIYVHKTLAYRNKKGGKVQFAKGVKLIEGTPTDVGGSNAYPRVCFKEGYCVLEFICDGFPRTSYLNGWKTEVISIEPTNPQ